MSIVAEIIKGVAFLACFFGGAALFDDLFGPMGAMAFMGWFLFVFVTLKSANEHDRDCDRIRDLEFKLSKGCGHE